MSTCIRASFIRAAFLPTRGRQLSLLMNEHGPWVTCARPNHDGYSKFDEDIHTLPIPPALIQERRALARLKGYFLTPYCSSWSKYCETPGLFRVMGKISDAPSIGIVGARKAQAVALHRSYMLGRLVARSGCVTVSGGAMGVDIRALEGAHEAGGPTMTVLGSGLSHPSPRRHLGSFSRFSTRGAIISPYPCNFRATRWSFVRRNRWIAEMSKSLVVIHVTAKSGAMHTVRHALDMGRSVFLLRTHRNLVHQAYEQELLDQKVKCASLLVERLVGLAKLSSVPMPRRESLRMILNFIGVGAIEHEKLREHLDLSLRDMLLSLFELERRGLVARDESGLWYRRGLYWNHGRDWWLDEDQGTQQDL